MISPNKDVIALIMEAVQSSEKLVNLYQSARCYNAEDSHIRFTAVFEGLRIFRVLILLPPYSANFDSFWYYVSAKAIGGDCFSLLMGNISIFFHVRCCTTACSLNVIVVRLYGK
jgi:hypothetical protein